MKIKYIGVWPLKKVFKFILYYLIGIINNFIRIRSGLTPKHYLAGINTLHI